MLKKLLERYRVERDAMQISYEQQMGLRENPEYEKFADDLCIEILNYFSTNYPSIRIEIPKQRLKSPKSLYNKIKNKQIERISKLYTIREITDEEKQQIFSVVKDRLSEHPDLDIDKILNSFDLILNEDVKNFDVNEVIENITEEGISDSTKKALLRMLISKLEKSSLKNKNKIIDNLDKKYGKQAATNTGIPERDIIQYSSIESLRRFPYEQKKVEDEQSYLKSTDLIGMKIILESVPKEFSSLNSKIVTLVKLRDKAEDGTERRQYDHMLMTALADEFMEKITKDKELLEKMNIEILPESKKHKKKTNGYEADHVKFRSLKNKQFTLELQMKSKYVEELARGNGSAAHHKRPGKERVLPSTKNKKEFLSQIKSMIPRYKVFKQSGNTYIKKEFNLLENTISYFDSQLFPGTEEYERVFEILREDMIENQRK